MPAIDSTKINSKMFGEKEFLLLGLTTTQTAGLASGNPIRFDTVFAGSSTKVLSLNPATYTVTLPPNSTFKMQAACGTDGSGAGFIQTKWYNKTTSLYITSSLYGNAKTPTYSGNQVSQPNSMCVFKTGATPVEVQLYIHSISNITQINYTQTWALIEKMEESVPVSYKADYWDDLRFPATTINPPGPATDPTWDLTNIGWAFSASATNSLQIIAQLPHSYKQGTAVYPHLHWEPSNTDTGNCFWRISYRWRNNGETAGALTDVDILVPAGGTALTLQIDAFASIAKANALISSIIELTLSRLGADGTDSFTGTAILKEFDIHYMLSNPGSLTQWA